MDSGAMLAGRYRLTMRLGQGGMGEVWAADDIQLRRRVAVKIVLANLGGSAEVIARLRREAENAAQLQHPGITVVHDIGEHDGHPYFVMELLDGTDFTEILARHPRGLPIGRVLETGAAVAEALAYAHRRRVVHRDIKPANLMELAEGGVKICDFGISRSADATGRLTATGGMLGTPAYMAPEQYEGRHADARTDLYAFGCTLYALLTGNAPFDGETLPALMRQHLTVEPVPPSRHRPEIPADLDRLVLWLLAKNPTERPGDAEDVARRLRALVMTGSVPHGDPALVPPPPDPLPATPQPMHQTPPPQPWHMGGPAPSHPPVMGHAQPLPPPMGHGQPPPPPMGRMPHTGPRRRGPKRRGVLIGGLVVFAGAATGGAALAARELLGSSDSGSDGRTLTGHTKDVNAVAFSPDGRTLASGGSDGTVRLWDMAAQRPVAVLDDYPDEVQAVTYSPDGKILAAAGSRGGAQLWDTTTRRAIGALKDSNNVNNTSLAFGRNGRILAVGDGGSNTLQLWNVITRRKVAELSGVAYHAESVAFSPDGELLAVGSNQNQVSVWDVAAQRRVAEFQGHSDATFAVAFSPDGKTVASGGGDNKVKLWSVTGKRLTSTFSNPANWVKSLAFSRDGRYLAAGDGDGTAWVWNLSTNKPTTFKVRVMSVEAIAFSPDGRTLATGHVDKTVRLWKVAV